MSTPQTYRLVTVNNTPERAYRLIGRVAEAVKEKYIIQHVGNADSIEQVRGVVEEFKPDILFTASMWTPEQAKEAIETAKSIVPDVKTHSIPQGLQVERGPDAIVEYLVENLPTVIGS